MPLLFSDHFVKMASPEAEEINTNTAKTRTPSENDRIVEDTTTTVVENTARDFAEYVILNTESEKHQLDVKIEEMLTRLDEFCAVVDMIRTDSSLSLNRSLPSIHAKAQDIRRVFTRIDRLEEFVSVVRNNISAIEEEVIEAEKEQGTFHSIKNLLSSLPVFTQKRGVTSKQPKVYSPMEVFKTCDYIKTVSLKQSEEEDGGGDEGEDVDDDNDT